MIIDMYFKKTDAGFNLFFCHVTRYLIKICGYQHLLLEVSVASLLKQIITIIFVYTMVYDSIVLPQTLHRLYMFTINVLVCLKTLSLKIVEAFLCGRHSKNVSHYGARFFRLLERVFTSLLVIFTSIFTL